MEAIQQRKRRETRRTRIRQKHAMLFSASPKRNALALPVIACSVGYCRDDVGVIESLCNYHVENGAHVIDWNGHLEENGCFRCHIWWTSDKPTFYRIRSSLPGQLPGLGARAHRVPAPRPATVIVRVSEQSDSPDADILRIISAHGASIVLTTGGPVHAPFTGTEGYCRAVVVSLDGRGTAKELEESLRCLEFRRESPSVNAVDVYEGVDVLDASLRRDAWR